MLRIRVPGLFFDESIFGISPTNSGSGSDLYKLLILKCFFKKSCQKSLFIESMNHVHVFYLFGVTVRMFRRMMNNLDGKLS